MFVLVLITSETPSMFHGLLDHGTISRKAKANTSSKDQESLEDIMRNATIFTRFFVPRQ
jgi:hypothetical protein